MNLSNYNQIKIKDFTSRYSKSLWYKIKKYNGSINAPSADCYVFIIDKPDWNDWMGGYDWSDNLIDPLEYLYNFKNHKLYQIK